MDDLSSRIAAPKTVRTRIKVVERTPVLVKPAGKVKTGKQLPWQAVNGVVRRGLRALKDYRRCLR